MAECKVLSGSFAIFVQGLLAAGVVATLLYKRLHEWPKRTWTIWLMDTSKQCAAMGVQHFVNVGLAILFTQGLTLASQCIWYLTSFSITVICGIVVLTLYMSLHEYLVERYRLTWLRSGDYGEPPRWQIWLVQLLLWVFVCCVEKFVGASIIWIFHDTLDTFTRFLEAPLRPYPRVELVLVMIIFPVLLNSVFTWLVDNLIQRGAPVPAQTGLSWERSARRLWRTSSGSGEGIEGSTAQLGDPAV